MQSHGKNEIDFQASVQYDVRVSVQDATRQKYPGYAAQISWKKMATWDFTPRRVQLQILDLSVRICFPTRDRELRQGLQEFFLLENIKFQPVQIS